MRPRKFDEVSGALETAIVLGELKPGDPLPSQSRLCERYAVSRSCLQKALEELTAKGLIESRPGKGVYVRGATKDSTKERRFKNVALIFHQEFRLESDASDNFGLEMLWGAEEALREYGANCIIRKSSRAEGFERIVPELESIGADAFIMDREFDDAKLAPLRALGVPVAVLGRLSALPFVSSSLPNLADGFLRAFARMADEGRKSLAFVRHPGHYYAPEMDWALKQAGAARPSMSFESVPLSCPLGAPGEGGVAGALERIFAKGAPEILAFANDWQALSALELLAKRGVKVPEELSVLGCFDIAAGAKSKPALSTISLDARELGRRAVRLLAASALNGAPPGVERVPSLLVERESFQWKSNPEKYA